MRAQGSTSSTRARATGPTWPTCRPTSAGARAAIGAGIGDRRPLRPHPGARRAGLGDHSRAGAAARRADHRQARQGLVLRHRSRAASCARAASPISSSPASPPTSACTPPCARPTTAASNADPRGLLRRHRHRQPRGAHQDGEDAERRVRRGAPRSSSGGPDHEALAVDDGALAVATSRHRHERSAISKRFGDRARADDVSLKLPRAAFTRCSARTAPARARSSSASWAIYRADSGSVLVDGREPDIASPRDAACPRHRHGLSALHAGAEHDRGREHGHGARATCRCVIDWTRGDGGARRLHGAACRSRVDARRARCRSWPPARSRRSRC